jgi:uncharacterized Zn finger protein (UPF0148 family)
MKMNLSIVKTAVICGVCGREMMSQKEDQKKLDRDMQNWAQSG